MAKTAPACTRNTNTVKNFPESASHSLLNRHHHHPSSGTTSKCRPPNHLGSPPQIRNVQSLLLTTAATPQRYPCPNRPDRMCYASLGSGCIWKRFRRICAPIVLTVVLQQLICNGYSGMCNGSIRDFNSSCLS